jgi:AraC-like DNA-binding protein
MHLGGMVLFRAEFREPWSVLTPESCELARVLPIRSEHIIPFHIVASGRCRLEMQGREPVWLGEGDAVLFPYGDGHVLGGSEQAATVLIGQLLPTPPWTELLAIEHGGSGAKTIVICGFLHCADLLFRPILRYLPNLLHVQPEASASEDWLAGTIRHTASEASRRQAGSRSMLPRLTELMFVEILRKHMQGLSAEEVGWFAAYNDPVAGAALKHLHAMPLHDWTVEDLARRVGVSRTVLAERFKHFLDIPPMQYLAQWRLRLAAHQLKSTDLPIKIVAAQTAYESEAAFCRAFKRHFGLSPSDWRMREAERSPS